MLNQNFQLFIESLKKLKKNNHYVLGSIKKNEDILRTYPRKMKMEKLIESKF